MGRDMSAIPKGQKCCAHVGGSFYGRCARNAKTQEGGKFYCTQHAPSAIKARSDARNAEWNVKWAGIQKARARESQASTAKAACVDAIKQIAAGHNDPRALAAEVLAMFPEGYL